MLGNPLRGRTLEQSFSLSTALLVVILIGTTMLVVENRVKSNMRRALEDRGTAIARSIGAVATPSLLAYNYAALQMAAEGAAGNEGLVYVAIHDKEGVLAGAAGLALALAVGLGCRDLVRDFVVEYLRSIEEERRVFGFEMLQVEYTQLAEYGGDILVEHDVTFDLFTQMVRRERTLSAAWNAYRLPIVVHAAGTGVRIWGRVRPGSGIRSVQLERPSGNGFVAAGRRVKTDEGGYFTAALPRQANYRYRAFDEHGNPIATSRVATPGP